MQADAIRRKHLVGARRHFDTDASPDDDRRDHVPGTSCVVVEQAEDRVFAEAQPELLVELAERGLGRRLITVAATDEGDVSPAWSMRELLSFGPPRFLGKVAGLLGLRVGK